MVDRVRLRPHHLLCILTYKGLGYSDMFIKNMDDVVDRIHQGSEIEIVFGLDDICSVLHLKNHPSCDHAQVCITQSVHARDLIALRAFEHALQLPRLKEGETLVLKKGEIRHLRALFQEGKLRQACRGCPWFQVCSDIALPHNYEGVRLLPAAVPNPSRLRQPAYE